MGHAQALLVNATSVYVRYRFEEQKYTDSNIYTDD